MKISEFGEFAFINHIAPPFLQDIPENVKGIGDDCAVIPWKDDEYLLVTTDMLIEDSHFLLSRIPAKDLGYKALAVNLSDIAAMGGLPHSAFISIGIPAHVEIEWLDEFYKGIYLLAKETRVNLLGGDTTKSTKHLVVNIVVLGLADRKFIKFRSGAQEGDVLCVTDFLGDSGAGLRVLLENLPLNDLHQSLVNRHHLPRPHIPEGQWLGQRNGVHGMIDVSDGIDSDIRRIMESSNCGAEVELGSLPLSNHLKQAAVQNGWNAHEIAATGGEDYCLLCSVDADEFANIAIAFEGEFGRELFRIGTITSAQGVLTYRSQGKLVQLGKHGFDHFLRE